MQRGILFLLHREEDWQFLVDQLCIGGRAEFAQLVMEAGAQHLGPLLAKRVVADTLFGNGCEVVLHNLTILLRDKVILQVRVTRKQSYVCIGCIQREGREG